VYLLALHEIGHAIGLGDSGDADSVMCNADPSSASLRRQYLWHKLGAAMSRELLNS
jgi:hypothetical protein